MSELFAAVARLAGRPRPRLAVPHAAIRAGAALGLVNRNEAILARTPAYFSWAKAARELGYQPGPVEPALARAVEEPSVLPELPRQRAEPDHGEEDQPDDQHPGDDVTAFWRRRRASASIGASLTHAARRAAPSARSRLVAQRRRARARPAPRPARGSPKRACCRAAPRVAAQASPSPGRRPPATGRRPRSARRGRRPRRRPRARRRGRARGRRGSRRAGASSGVGGANRRGRP